MDYNNDWLKQQIADGIQPQYVFFWGHHPNKNGEIGKPCLSQWYESSFEYKDITYLTAEHWMMAEKARLFKDEKILEEILKSQTPHEAKHLGRKVNGFDVNVWKQHCVSIVSNGNYLKFSQNDELKAFLHSTEDKVLVEASPYDQIWGIGLKSSAKGVEDPNNWRGGNLLGYALMMVRDQLFLSKG